MTKTIQVNTRVEPAFAEQLDTLASVTGRTRASLLYQALRTFLSSEREFLAAVERGRADVRAGRVTEWGDFERELDAITGPLSSTQAL